MPNNIDNIISVLGSPDDVSAFVATARGQHPKTGDAGRFAEEDNGVRPVKAFNFHSLVPLPPEYSTRPYGDGSAGCGFDLECETWGVKWGSYTHKEPDRDPGLATYAFGTAWDAPYKVFLPKVAERFPALTFLLSWGGEGPTRGRMTFQGEKRTGRKDEYRDGDYPKYSDDMTADQERAWSAAYEAVTNVYLASHPLWVGLMIARRAGQNFKPAGVAPVLADWLQENGYDTLAATVRALDAGAKVGRMALR